MFARVETFKVQPDEVDTLLTGQHQTVGRVRTMNGNMGGYVLVNRDQGQLANVTFWQSREEQEAAETEFAAAGHGDVVEYAVAMQEALSG